MCKLKFCEIWHPFSRAPIRNFPWCYYKWRITSLALEKCKKRMQYALNYSDTRFLPWPKIKITQFPSEFRHNPLEWKYDGTEPFHSNCSEGEILKRPPHLAQLTGQCNITVPRHRQKLLAWTALACLQQLLPPQGFRPEAKSRGGTLVTRAYV